MKVQIIVDVETDWFDDPENVTVEEIKEMAQDDPRGFLEDAAWAIVVETAVG